MYNSLHDRSIYRRESMLLTNRKIRFAVAPFFLPDMKMMVLKDSKCDDMASYVTK